MFREIDLDFAFHRALVVTFLWSHVSTRNFVVIRVSRMLGDININMNEVERWTWDSNKSLHKTPHRKWNKCNESKLPRMLIGRAYYTLLFTSALLFIAALKSNCIAKLSCVKCSGLCQTNSQWFLRKIYFICFMVAVHNLRILWSSSSVNGIKFSVFSFSETRVALGFT